MSGSRMIPSCSSDSCSSRSDSIIPSDTSPRSFAWRSGSGEPGSTAPGSATTTVSPVTKFEAPQTIWRGSPSPTSTWHSRRRSAFGCLPNSTTRPILKLPWFAPWSGAPRVMMRSTSSPDSTRRSASSGSGRSNAT